jgi:hypothetical protein
MPAALRSIPPPRIPLAEVSVMSREVAGACSRPLDVVGVMPTEGGGDRVEVFVAPASRREPGEPVSVVVDRAVPPDQLKRDLDGPLPAGPGGRRPVALRRSVALNLHVRASFALVRAERLWYCRAPGGQSMLAPVSNSRAQHDGFAVLVVIVLIVAACVAGYWFAENSAGGSSPHDRRALSTEP